MFSSSGQKCIESLETEDKSGEVQKTIWKFHKVIWVMYKSREVQKTVWKSQKVIMVIFKSREVQKTIGNC